MRAFCIKSFGCHCLYLAVSSTLALRLFLICKCGNKGLKNMCTRRVGACSFGAATEVQLLPLESLGASVRSWMFDEASNNFQQKLWEWRFSDFSSFVMKQTKSIMRHTWLHRWFASFVSTQPSSSALIASGSTDIWNHSHLLLFQAQADYAFSASHPRIVPFPFY